MVQKIRLIKPTPRQDISVWTVGQSLYSRAAGICKLQSIPEIKEKSGRDCWYATVSFRSGQTPTYLCIDHMELFPNELFVLDKVPQECGVCGKWFDASTLQDKKCFCPKCIEDMKHPECLKEDHTFVEVPGRSIGEPQWNCFHYTVCTKCGKLSSYDSSG